MTHPTARDAYPLKWPAGWPRSQVQRSAKFHTVQGPTAEHAWKKKAELSVWDATQRILRALAQMGGKDVVISTDIPLRQDGLPMSNRRAPSDNGAAVYWMLDGESQCMAVDLYDRIADNLAAVAATIDAMRAIERHGGAQILKRAWMGLKALPASTAPVMTTVQAAEQLAKMAQLPGSATSVLASADEARRIARIATSHWHPDRNRGSQTEFLLVQECKRIVGTHHGASL